MDTIQKTISAEAITGFNRVARHENFVILADLNMVQQVRVVTLDEQGIPILERIAGDENLTPAQKQAASMRYQDQIVTKQTTGAFVSATTGQVVEAGTEGSVPQRAFFQAITLGQLTAMGLSITDKTSVAELIYALIGNEIGGIDARGTGGIVMHPQPIIVRYKEEDTVKPDRWELYRSVTFYTKAGRVTVPRGYVTDFASVPMLLWGFFPPIGRHNRATILHDWWYDNRLFEEELGAKEARRMADLELYERLKVAEPNKPVRNYCMYLACRWFGRSWWVK